MLHDYACHFILGHHIKIVVDMVTDKRQGTYVL